MVRKKQGCGWIIAVYRPQADRWNPKPWVYI